jgi:hypothetical protein
MIHGRHQQRRWIVILEPDADDNLPCRRDRLRGVRMAERSLQVTARAVPSRPTCTCRTQLVRRVPERLARQMACSSSTTAPLADPLVSRLPRLRGIS